ncbi:hypothetical protein GCM10009827_016690 [Dactylosporangium maewongense]|uniref:HEPN domain-containing protein n=2 Tax=Micromonosporaceae TaxID=28056 RepID=A0ABN1ZT86_9ACTN
MRWEQGRSTLDDMLTKGLLERVPPSREHADAMIDQARRHLAAAGVIATVDPIGAYQLAYDAARKALTAVLENQGLRPTRAGGHIAVLDAVRAQVDPPLGGVLRPFDRMRRRRNDAEYPAADRPALTADEVVVDRVKVDAIIELAGKVLDQMSPY